MALNIVLRVFNLVCFIIRSSDCRILLRIHIAMTRGRLPMLITADYDITLLVVFYVTGIGCDGVIIAMMMVYFGRSCIRWRRPRRGIGDWGLVGREIDCTV